MTAGLAMAAVTTVSGAMLPIITRYGATHIDPMLFCAGASVIACGCAMPFMAGGDGVGILVRPRHRWLLGAISMTGSFLPGLAMVFGMRRVNAVAAVLLLQLEPVYSLVIATLVVGEAPSARQIVATAAILAGIVSAFWGGAGIFLSPAAVLIALTPLMWQISHVITLRVMPPLRPVSVTAARNAYASILLTAMLLVSRPAALRQLAQFNTVATLIATGAMVYFIGTLTWYGAISRLSLSWTTALVVPGSPILAVLLAAIFLGERAGARQLAAIGVAIAGIMALVLGADPSRPGAAQLEAIEVPAPPGA